MTQAETPERIREERGATAVEYALFMALVAGIIVFAVTTLGTGVESWFDRGIW